MPEARRLLSSFALAAVVCFSAWPAEAQIERAPRGFRGLFGGNEADPRSRQALDFSASLLFGYDDNVTSGESGGAGGPAGSPVDPRFQQSSNYYGGSASLSYNVRGERVSFGASGTTSARLYTELNDLVGLNHGAGVGLTARTSRRGSISLNQAVSYSPYYSFGLLPPLFLPELGAPPAFNEDFVIEKREAWQYSTTAGLTQQLASRTSFNASYGYGITDFTNEDRKLRSHSARAGFSQGLTRYASARLGYGYGRGEYDSFAGGSRTRETHNIDAGIDYARALSFSRRTTFSFGSGSTILKSETRTYAQVTGRATLDHQMGRSWSASVAYNRGLGFRDGFDEPIFADSVVAGVGGYLGQRARLQFSAGYSTGEVGVDRDQGYDTAYGAATLQFALTRYMAAVASYNYYRYRFDSTLDLPPGVSPELDRQAYRVGLTFWVPLLR